jgi:hypothetical protein
LDEHWFVGLDHAREVIEAWRVDYNDVRPHSALDNLTPAEFARRARAELRSPPAPFVPPAARHREGSAARRAEDRTQPADDGAAGLSCPGVARARPAPRRRHAAACAGRAAARHHGLLGHSQIAVTLNLYSHILPEVRRDAADKMDAIFSSGQ